MLSGDIIENGVDGDGDGYVWFKIFVVDVLMFGGKMFDYFGWCVGEFWL